MRKRIGIIWWLLIMILFLSPAFGLAASKPGFTKVTLKNGITLLYWVMKGEPLISVDAVFPVGMTSEKQRGLAHLLEHLVFRGGSDYHYTDIADVTHRKGGMFNGFTSSDVTSYNYVFPKEDLAKGLAIFNSSIWQTTIADGDLALEKKIVTHELNMDYSERYRDYPIYRYFYPEFSYTAESVAAITADDIRSFQRTYYQPQRATYIIAGEFDPEVVKSSLEKIAQEQVTPETAPDSDFNLPSGDVVESRNLYPYQFEIMIGYQFSDLTPLERAMYRLLISIYKDDVKIDYENNQFKIYNVINRTLGSKDFFGIYYLERTTPYSDERYAVEKAQMRKYFREFQKIDLKKAVSDLQDRIELDYLASQQSAPAVVGYEVTRLADPDTLTIDALPLLKQITPKNFQEFIEKRFSGSPQTWILIKTTK
ncbi:MAG TPA: pitrilysin family protein [Bacillota bacterium]|nr:pitrilysin family protein [Bacillota bacterium]